MRTRKPRRHRPWAGVAPRKRGLQRASPPREGAETVWGYRLHVGEVDAPGAIRPVFHQEVLVEDPELVGKRRETRDDPQNPGPNAQPDEGVLDEAGVDGHHDPAPEEDKDRGSEQRISEHGAQPRSPGQGGVWGRNRRERGGRTAVDEQLCRTGAAYTRAGARRSLVSRAGNLKIGPLTPEISVPRSNVGRRASTFPGGRSCLARSPQP